jgi:hypothetical protein
MIISLISKKRAGKDTVSNILQNNNSVQFVRYGFADCLRHMAKEIFLWDDDWIENHKEEIDSRWGLSYRQFTQKAGTELFQYALCNELPKFNIVTGHNLWINRFKYIYEQNSSINYVITDTRFLHETKVLKDLGAIFVRIHRDSTEKVIDTHISENNLNSFKADYDIYNNGTLLDLENSVNALLVKINQDRK